MLSSFIVHIGSYSDSVVGEGEKISASDEKSQHKTFRCRLKMCQKLVDATFLQLIFLSEVLREKFYKIYRNITLQYFSFFFKSQYTLNQRINIVVISNQEVCSNSHPESVN